MALDLAAYFRRIGYAGSAEPSLETMRALQALHPLAIPFENLDAFAGVLVRLDLDSLQRKLVANKRGGYCFEQNTLFGAVLTAVGFDVTALSARVVWERPVDEVRPRTHMVLLVGLGRERYLCDVGFGGLTPTGPLLLHVDVEQSTPHEKFRVRGDEREYVVEARVRSEWKPLYRFDLQPQTPADIEVLNFFVTAHPESPMLGRIMAARVAADGRYALRNQMLAKYGRDGTQEQRELADVAALRAVLTDVFGIDVPRGNGLDEALERLLAAR